MASILRVQNGIRDQLPRGDAQRRVRPLRGFWPLRGAPGEVAGGGSSGQGGGACDTIASNTCMIYVYTYIMYIHTFIVCLCVYIYTYIYIYV